MSCLKASSSVFNFTEKGKSHMYHDITTEDLVVRYQAMTDKNSLEANELLREIWSRVSKLMDYFARSYSNIPNTDYNDRYSVLTERLLVALQQFDISYGYKFSTACKKFFMQGLNLLNRDMRREKRYNPNVVVGSYEVMMEIREEIEIDGNGEINYCEFNDVEINELLKSVNLDDDELAMCQYIIQGKSGKDIADIFGVSPQLISSRKKTLRKKLRPVLYPN